MTGYNIDRCSGTSCTPVTQIAKTSGTGTTYKDTTVSASTSYSYQVIAFDAAGNPSPPSNTASATTPAAPSGLVAAYSFDQGSGTTVTDTSGNGNNGTISTATWSTSGQYGDALSFNGTNALVTIPNSASLQLSSGMTLEAWVNPSKIDATWRDVIYKANDNFYLEATSTNASTPDAGLIAGGSYADAFGTAALPANTWSFLTETYDGSTLRLYVNGTQVASTAHTGAIATSTNPLQIGGDSLYGQYFTGLIDNVRIYNTALNAAQIQTDQATPITTVPLGPPTKLVFVQGPTNTLAGAAITPPVKVAVEDANGNIETADNTTRVSLAIGTNPAGGTLSGGSAVTVTSGVATFSGLSINTAGTGYTLTASSTPSYSAATSAAFNIITATSASWTTYLGGNDRTNFAAGAAGFTPTSVPNLGLAWEASDTGPSHGVYSQPIVSNGLVYWGSFDGYERATDTSGNLVWQTNLGTTSPSGCTDPSEAGVVSTPTITTDVPVGTATSVLYVAGGNGKMYALNAATGAVLWSTTLGPNSNWFIWSSPAVFGNSVYIGVSSFGDCPLVQGKFVQLNRVTGAVQNTFNVVPNGCTGGGVWGSPTVDAAAGTIYFATGNPGNCTSSEPLAPAVVEVHASDLSLVGSWSVPPAQQQGDSDFGSTPILFNGVIGSQSQPLVGVINKNGIFYAFERDALASGPVWSTQIASGGGDPPNGVGDVAPAAFDGKTLYVGGDNTTGCSGSVNALNPSTGAFIWQHCFTDGGFVIGAVASASGGVVAVGEGNNIVVVSAATGATLFTYTGTGPFWGAPTFAGGTLYEGDMAGHLYALR